MSVRLAAVIALAATVTAGGCTYTPGYFPYLIPPGPIEQTHAKPGGRGYFRDFDPKSHRLEVKPGGLVNAPLGSQIVLVATVYDKDGTPRRDRRVEWIVEGPGNIIEADESGVTRGRGYLIDNKRAVTHTSYVPKTITRGNDDPKDDVAVEPGQTFVVLSSAIPGETVVTAYAPEVFNWDNGRVVTKVMWGDARFKFPEPVTVRVGGETTLATSINPTATDAGGNFRVRYRVLEGPPATLVAAGNETVALSGSGGKEAEASLEGSNEATVRLVQRDPKAGKTRVAVEVVKPSESGVGPGAVVGRRETTIEWAAPSVKLKMTAPPVAGPNRPFPVTVTLENVAGVDSRDARISVALSDGATLERSDPPPTGLDKSGALTFDLPPVSGKGKQQVTLQVVPAKLGAVTVRADAVTGDGLQADTSETVRVEQAKLQVLVEAPAIALAGEKIAARVLVTNTGAAAAANVTVWARADDGLAPAADRKPIELPAGTLNPGQTKSLDLPLSAKAAGKFGVRASATGDGNLSGTAEPLTIEVRRAELAVAVSGSKLAYLNQQVSWTVTVTNRGDAAVSNVVVRAAVPAEVKVTAADGGSVGAGPVQWKIAELAPGAQKSFTLDADAVRLAPQGAVTVSALGDAVSNGKAVGAPVEARGEAAVAIIGTAALALELATPPGVVEAGKRAKYQIRVKNQGTVSARNIEVSATATPELKFVRGSGAAEGRADANGRITFTAVEELPPGRTLTFTVEMDAAQAGDARFKAEVKAAHLTNPLREEQATRVTGR
ncbi:Large cysteine-rich periplasmic protein OmcB precursor [Gemmata obscuriglobus]|uniref:DUF11 domain-containing protein n=1 Tax=Gemmata obscuriglobus TaxID=114 RepID=A0A2Z3H4M4_9BACT|nr:DUF11 domain-containing protein [Gemmata obscuriglobus]AWM41729.1 DUF11 domain-containing protein [Gemmata obscuriglobus]QEG32322.1 Large cysteine-rich periplasmic protein OmcB precursor [Gemmata obscuriglobus]VTS11678.1 repeat domain protein : Conserved repeat domain protein OS=Pirellula staleyi (strain ATCC 27377 / DSM 6068 / ICPB 4128) GN=Psta_2103 PE=4 SV=1: DUF11 [Gemmata obscuriglobus UQM 2246]